MAYALDAVEIDETTQSIKIKRDEESGEESLVMPLTPARMSDTDIAECSKEIYDAMVRVCGIPERYLRGDDVSGCDS